MKLIIVVIALVCASGAMAFEYREGYSAVEEFGLRSGNSIRAEYDREADRQIDRLQHEADEGWRGIQEQNGQLRGIRNELMIMNNR